MRKTIINDVLPIKCSHCPEKTEQSVDRARAGGWRIGWRPDHPTWCPTCFGAARHAARKQDIEPYDEPMF